MGALGLFPNFDFQMERPPVRADQVRKAMPNYDSAIEVDRVDAASLTADQFRARYQESCKPVVLKGALRHWKAYDKWDPDYLIAQAGDFPLKAKKFLTLDFILMAANRRLGRKAYMKAMDQWSEALPLAKYVAMCTTEFDPDQIRYVPNVQIPRSIYDDVGDISLFHGTTQNTSWFVGRRSYMDSHEHHGTDAFMGQVRGVKEVILHPPDGLHYRALYGSSMSLRLWSPVRFFGVDLKRYPLFSRNCPRVALVTPGDALYIPDPWWHAVMSADDEFSVTVTKWCSPHRLRLSHPQTWRQFIETPVRAVKSAMKHGVSIA